MEVEGEILSYVEKDEGKLKHFRAKKHHSGETRCPEASRSHYIPLSTLKSIVHHSLFFAESQRRYFIPGIEPSN